MAKLVQGYRVQIISPIDVERLASVEDHVAGDGVVIDRRRHIGESQGAATGEAVATNADVAHAGVTLLIIARTTGRAVVDYHREVDVGGLGPGLGGLQDDVFPGAGGAKLVVEGAKQIAGFAAEVGAIRHEADRDQLRVRPGIARKAGRHHSFLQTPYLKARGTLRGMTTRTSAGFAPREGQTHDSEDS